MNYACQRPRFDEQKNEVIKRCHKWHVPNISRFGHTHFYRQRFVRDNEEEEVEHREELQVSSLALSMIAGAAEQLKITKQCRKFQYQYRKRHVNEVRYAVRVFSSQ